MKITPVIAGEGFGQHNRRNQSRPLAPAAQLLEACPVLDEHRESARVEDQRHAERRP